MDRFRYTRWEAPFEMNDVRINARILSWLSVISITHDECGQG